MQVIARASRARTKPVDMASARGVTAVGIDGVSGMKIGGPRREEQQGPGQVLQFGSHQLESASEGFERSPWSFGLETPSHMNPATPIRMSGTTKPISTESSEDVCVALS